MKLTKKIAYLIFALSIALTSFQVFGIKNTISYANDISNTKYIYQPTYITTNGDTIFSFDETLKQIKANSIADGSLEKNIDFENVNGLYYKGNHLFVLTRSTNNQCLLYKLNSSLEETSSSNINLSMQISNEDSLFAGIINIDVFETETSNIVYIYIIYTSNLNTTSNSGPQNLNRLAKLKIDTNYSFEEQEINVAIIDINAPSTLGNKQTTFSQTCWQKIVVKSENEMYISLDDTIYTTYKSADSYNASVWFSTSGLISDIALSQNGNIFFSKEDSNLKQLFIVTNSPKEEISLESLPINHFCINNSNIYATDTTNSKIIKIELKADEKSVEKTTDFITNVFNSPSDKIISGREITIKKVKSETKLLEKPFNTNELISVPKDAQVMVLKEEDPNSFLNYTYCMFSTEQSPKNYYGFIKTNDLEDVETNNETSTIFIDKGTQIHTFPSLCEDDYNKTLKILDEKTEATKLSSQNFAIYGTNANITIYKVRLNNGMVGYISQTQISATENSIKEYVTTNCEVFKDAELFEDENGTSSYGITLKKGTRVKVSGSLKYNNEYTKVTFNDDVGNKIEGFVLTSCLKKDGLSTLQIVGICLLAANLVFLAIIISVKKKMTKE